MADALPKTLYWDQGLYLLNQTRLPNEESYVCCQTPAEVALAIRAMVVRGAPAIGVAAAYGMALAAQTAGEDGFLAHMQRQADNLGAARPTAVNLFWAIERMMNMAKTMDDLPQQQRYALLLQEAKAIHQQDADNNRALGENLLSLLKPGMGILTHCNAGALATAAYGTALAPLYLAAEKGIPLKIYADETRPRLQGASLTAYELHKAGLDITLSCDNMAAVLMQSGRIDAVITGCDRVAANGDAANKIGTFGLSILARHFNIPFYIAAPVATIDYAMPAGKNIPIEYRDGDEIRKLGDCWVAPKNIPVFNPAFDVTPAAHIAAIVSEKGIALPPYEKSLAAWAQRWS